MLWKYYLNEILSTILVSLVGLQVLHLAKIKIRINIKTTPMPPVKYFEYFMLFYFTTK